MIKQGMIRIAVLVALVCLVGVGVRAQDVNSTSSTDTTAVQPLTFGSPISGGSAAAAKPRPAPGGPGGGFVFFLGYSFLDSNITQGNSGDGECNFICFGRSGAHGFEASGAWMMNENFGLMADVSAHFGGPTLIDQDGDGTAERLDQNSYYILGGPTVSKKIGKVTLNAHALVGIARLWAKSDFRDCRTCAFFRDESTPLTTGVAVGLGGSADVMLSSRLGWRIVQVDWLWSDNRQNICDNFTCNEQASVSGVRISTGPVFNWGMR